MKRLIPKHISILKPYQSARRIGIQGRIYLNANESPWINNIQYKFNNLNRYPEFQPYKLLKKYSLYSGVPINQILITRGADEGIEIITRTFCESNIDKIMFFPPTYDMYNVIANIFNIKKIIIPILSNFQLDIKNIKKKINNVKIIYICYPNNPTGNFFSRNKIIRIINSVSKTTLIVIDEAYIDFSIKYSFVSELNNFDNLIILRTLSKSFGLSAIRCGFVLSNVKIIKILKKVLAPYPISIPVSDIAIQSLCSQNIFLMQKNILRILKNKKFLIDQLKKISYIKNIFHSEANFILIKFAESKTIFKYLISKGIIVRDQSHNLGLKNCLRISIGTIHECQELINVLSIYKGKI
ncbi:histidinol-phosphate transaminase [Buchnera aphidicola]|uniref:Histidinol-phosphate aminotransferase n=1 Tax=Buchnera aphidicola subsp. Cinara cedri (strain Cc) TaxID=372461 RepID=HIS8_BUCCC|nr:histidinol-phosphate transaminase [Buchnera aphidicola]Q058A6.1 RecName: Full=Histidinol-phosphate aminotransferase; AltName: Full=Imidazole acetol-phosphate transaminase [Buchnera aphidicola BCc]ABJ90543.1 histidinol-phosphate aminotransferase [Buchnera aphidicola BCc]